ncbi:SymE family type I addiction module toxin [Arsenicibacter rosenii]|uniref:SymE family type I addiction module toxin n=1 Tax=Arsenicibacter rosenii TaxID=1750698 RepID=UPI0009F54B2F|nr:SymE family type I addiction module toxin [Arsenicibacter rosenii]
MKRIRKIQARYKVSGAIGYRKTTVTPSLELAGNWFEKAGFLPNQLVNIVCEDGAIIIRKQ